MAPDYAHPSRLWSLPAPTPRALRSWSDVSRLHFSFFFLQNESTWVMNSSATKAVIFSHTNKTLPVKLLEDPFQTIKLLPTSWTCHSFCFQCGSMELPRYSICPECPSPAFPTWHTKTCPPVASFKATTSVRLCFPPSFYFPLLFFPFMPYFTYSNSP